MKQTILFSGLLLLLCGCGAEYEKKMALEREEEDDRLCVSYGTKRGTSNYVDCRVKLEAATRTGPIIVRDSNSIGIMPSMNTIIPKR